MYKRQGRHQPVSIGLEIIQPHLEQFAGLLSEPPLHVIIHRLMNGVCSRTLSLAGKLSEIIVGIGDHGLLSVIELRGLFGHTAARIVFKGTVEHVGRAAMGIAFALRQQISDQIVSTGRAENVAPRIFFDGLDYTPLIVVIEGPIMIRCV